jgi:glucuronyl/N-acetylglucosaminyl transferase EXT2
MPRPIYEHIDTNFNCEDIAMSYFVSTLTGGKPPLLGDHWAVVLELQMEIQNGLSWKSAHMVRIQGPFLQFHIFSSSELIALHHLFATKDLRHVCLNDFAELLGLKEGVNAKSGVEVRPLKFGTVKHNERSCFGYGDEPDCWSNIDSQSFSHAPRLQKLIEELKWRESLPEGEDAKVNAEWLAKMKVEMQTKPAEAGLVKRVECDERFFFC